VKDERLLLDLVIILGGKMVRIKGRELFAPLMVVFLLASLSAQAAEPQQPSAQQTSDEELVKQRQNPVADLISVPLQNNLNFGTGSVISEQ
jgi:hypothetical protein